MSKGEGSAWTLGGLDEIARASRQFEEAERRLREEHSRRVQSFRAREASADREADRRLAEATVRLQEATAERKREAEARHRARAARLRVAHRNARKAAEASIEAEEGKRKFTLQRDVLRATRERDAGVSAAEAALADFRRRLEESALTLEIRDQEAGVLLGGTRGERNREPSATETAADRTRNEVELCEELERLLAGVGDDLERVRRGWVPRLSRSWPVWLMLALLPLPLLPVMHFLGYRQFTYWQAGGIASGVGMLGWVVYLVARRAIGPTARRVREGLARARALHRLAGERALETHREERERLESAHAETTRSAEEAWRLTLEEVERARTALPTALDAKLTRAGGLNDRVFREACFRLEADHGIAVERLRREDVEEREARAVRGTETVAGWEAELEQARTNLRSEWAGRTRGLLRGLKEAARSLGSASVAEATSGEAPRWSSWEPSSTFDERVRWGRASVDRRLWLGEADSEVGGALELPDRFAVPLELVFPDQGSLILEAGADEREAAVAALNRVALELLAAVPPGRVVFTLVDPVRLGQSFAGLMHLADEAEHLMRGRIWTQPAQIDECLRYLEERMEKVIQMYLRNEFATLTEYNAQPGHLPEPYHFLLVADFPANFGDAALQRLGQILANGPRCGVFVLLHRDSRTAPSRAFSAEELRRVVVARSGRGTRVVVNEGRIPGVETFVDSAPPPESVTAFIQRVGRASVDSNRVEIPFEQVAPDESALWSLETIGELRVPIGRSGASKLQYLAIGRGTRQHVLVAGKTGSGKSTLFHVVITNLAAWCSPDEVEFYLVDFKKGVEFKCYAEHRLPHARVVAIESDREFGASVLQRIDDELRRRGDLFRAAGVQDLAGYRKAGGAERLPRVLLVVDEFQEFFVEEDRVAQTASLLLDRIVRQGRAFGIHALLGSQTLGGAYGMARATLGQMVIRIALQCNEADACLIMDENNPAPRLLSRPGEGIYNDAAGVKEGNSPFQVVWLPDETRDRMLRRIRNRADAASIRMDGPMVFEGNAPAEVRGNPNLAEVLAGGGRVATVSPAVPRIWLGAPNSIKGPTEVTFEKRSGSHLLLVGQRDEAAQAMLGIAVLALAAQLPDARFLVLDGSPAESGSAGLLDDVCGSVPGGRVRRVRPGEVEEAISEWGREFDAVQESAGQVGVDRRFLVIHGLQQFRKLRIEDDLGFGGSDAPASAGAVLRRIVTEGATMGWHVLAGCDTYGNAVRFLGRKALAEFGYRVLFQMGANDSASLIDSPAANRLGLQRALLFVEGEGRTEIFRPYALPDRAWLEAIRGLLASSPLR